MALQNEKGQLVAEFLFAITIGFGLFILFFVMCFTFSTIEVSQYVVYSAARTHAAGNLDRETQKQEAIKKFNALRNSEALKSLYTGDWYTFGPIEDNMFRQGTSETYSPEFSNQTSGTDEYKKVFVGLSVPFEAKIMAMRIPFISTGGDPEDDTSIFKTNINTMLLREISQVECQTEHWGDTRKTALQGLKSGAQFYKPEKYFRMEDNGC